MPRPRHHIVLVPGLFGFAKLGSLGRMDRALGLEIKLLERTTELLLKFLGIEGQPEVREWIEGIRSDQGAIIQLTPESMDIFNAGIEDNANIRYGCVVTRMPAAVPVRLIRDMRSPGSLLSVLIFSTLYVGAGRTSKVYPPPNPAPELRKYLETGPSGER